MSRFQRPWLGLARLALRYAGFRLAEPRRRRWSTAERLAALPRKELPLDAPIEIRWNDWQVPYIQADSERDLAIGLGVTHGHLRLFQMEIMRRLAWGRLSEMLGPVAVDMDRSLRIVGFARPVTEIERRLPPATRSWLEGFRDGVNAVIANADEPPEEFRLLGFTPQPWSLSDLIAIGRLAASDFSWKVWRRLLPHRGRNNWPDAWERLMAEGGTPTPSLSGGGDLFEICFGALNRGGSNSLAVAAEKSASGAAMIASDPHLGVILPNLWLIAGVEAPSIHAVGFMIPGVPVVALGRNPDIAWGGTSLHAASSDLFDVSDLAPSEITTHEERIKVRWGKEARVTLRSTEYGPIISDAPLLGMSSERPLAMRWIGHEPNDEITAMLGVLKARDWEAFRAALDGFAAPAQNMVYADARGKVGRAVAAHLPRRPSGPPEDLVQNRALAAHWQSIVVGSDFPASFAPKDGYVVSANNRPPAHDVPVGFFFSPDDRVHRMAALLKQADKVSAESLKTLQRDVAMPSAPYLADLMLELLADEAASHLPIMAALAAWDGRHDAESEGALAYELMVHHLLHTLHGASDRDLYLASWDLTALLKRDLVSLPKVRLATAAARAAKEAQEDFAKHGTWGAIHRLRLEHPFARAPFIGKRYGFADDAVGGGNETLMKTAHGVSRGVHRVGLGAVARHVSDFADPDANDFCLLGGQDGWIGSANFNDQYDLWRAGKYIRIPMTAAAVTAAFPHVVSLAPAARSVDRSQAHA